MGLYVLVEGYDKSFLKRHFKAAHGNLYDPGSFQDITESLERTSGEESGDRSDLKALAEAAKIPDPDARLQRLGAVLDLERFYSFLAMEIMASSWDGYALHRNNYRPYHDPSSGRFTFIPCGMDQLFTQPQSSLLADAGGLVAAAVLYSPAGRQRYRETCAQLLTNQLFAPDRLGKILDAAQQRLAPVLIELGSDQHQVCLEAGKRLRQRLTDRVRHLEKQLLVPTIDARF